MFSLKQLEWNTIIWFIIVLLLVYKYWSGTFEGFNARLRSYGYPYYWPYHLDNSAKLYRNRYDYKYRNLIRGNILLLE